MKTSDNPLLTDKTLGQIKIIYGLALSLIALTIMISSPSMAKDNNFKSWVCAS